MVHFHSGELVSAFKVSGLQAHVKRCVAGELLVRNIARSFLQQRLHCALVAGYHIGKHDEDDKRKDEGEQNQEPGDVGMAVFAETA